MQSLLRRLLQSPAASLATAHELQSHGTLVGLILVSCGLATCVSLSCLLSLLVDAVTGWLRPTTCFYWLALLTKNRLSNGCLFLVVAAIAVIELVVPAVAPATDSKSLVISTTVYLVTACLVFSSASSIGCFCQETAVRLIGFAFLVHIVTPEITSRSWSHFWLLAVTSFLGIVGARCTETMIGSQVLATKAGPGTRSFVWRRRHSSPRKTMQRRTSYPNLDTSRSFSFSQGSSVRAAACLREMR